MTALFKAPDGSLSRPLIALFLAVNGVVLLNAVLHNPYVGYDTAGHIRYIEVLSTFRLPTPADTHEYFNPPVSYALPALLLAARGATTPDTAAKFAQLLNLLYSCLLTFWLLKTCETIRPGVPGLKVGALCCLGMLPVYYKTFSQVRPEPLLAFLCVFAVHRALVLWSGDGGRPRDALVLGAALGLMVGTRQWGFLVLPALLAFAALLWSRHPRRRRHIARTLASGLAVTVLVGGGHYLHLARGYGDARAFNMPAGSGFAFANQSADFYFGRGSGKLFTDPVRPGFPNQLMPIFYSETWGDYWSSFLVQGWDERSRSHLSGMHLEQALARHPIPPWLVTNRREMGAYLGRVNRLSLAPTALLAAALVLGCRYLLRSCARRPPDDAVEMLVLPCLCVVFSLAGYLWFLVSYPDPLNGKTIKASYMIQVFPFLALLAAEALVRLRERSRRACWAVAALLAATFLHNVPALVTRYSHFAR